MKEFLKILILLWLSRCFHAVPTPEEYFLQRNQLSQEEESMVLGADLHLTDPKELRVNEILMNFKNLEFKEGLDSNGRHFAAAQHFFHSKSRIEESHVFKIIKLLPKGCGLHAHLTEPQVQFVVQNLTHLDNLYYCDQGLHNVAFRFHETQPEVNCGVNRNWTLVSELRRTSSSEEFVDSWFFNSLSLFTSQPEVDHPNLNEIWRLFEEKLVRMSGIVNHAPVLRQYFYQALQEFYEDNVLYIEQRSALQDAYNLDQSELSPSEILQLFHDVTEEFMKDHPDFWGVKLIYTPHRFNPPSTISEKLKEAIEIKERFGDFFAGFDLVGQEDLGTPLVDYLSEILEAAGKNLRFFFHAGETAWKGTKIDENLMDAILLNSSRLGHAFALSSHPILVDLVKEKGIAVECCPISNQVLKLVEDFRNHPMIPLMTVGFPLVISSDNPGMWGARGLSHDFYVAFMAMAGAKADLRFLKRIALNSIEYSAMSLSEKTIAYEKWMFRWEEFLGKVIEVYGSK